MVRLLIVADDFTGALDTGVQFTARGAKTRVVTDPAYDFSRTEADIQVLVLDAETRHLRPADACRVVFRAVRGALDAGFTDVYKKTDSALRGNVGAELSAVLDAAGAGHLAFLPALPKMSRVTRGGVQYVGGVPVSESVFGRDPFEPVTVSAVADLIGIQTGTPVTLHSLGSRDSDASPGIHVYDAETDADLMRIGRRLGRGNLRLSAGCSGFAAVLAEILGLRGTPPALPALRSSFFAVCGSVNPVTLLQMQTAEENGFPRVRLNPVQKLEPGWLESDACAGAVRSWLQTSAREGRFILDVNDPPDRDDTSLYAAAHGLSTEDLRRGISARLGCLIRLLLDGGLDATLLCTGGDTLLALMRSVQAPVLTPVCELDTGVVLTSFAYRGRTYHIISKSGGFGEPDLLCRLARSLRAGNQREDTVC